MAVYLYPDLGRKQSDDGKQIKANTAGRIVQKLVYAMCRFRDPTNQPCQFQVVVTPLPRILATPLFSHPKQENLVSMYLASIYGEAINSCSVGDPLPTLVPTLR
eukprot:scaffold21007_cov52-Attheya_sp.AAC.4